MGTFTKRGEGNRGKGRRKGVQNKTTRFAKEAIEEAFEKMGSVDALTKWAKANQKEFYTLIFPKLLPLQVHGDREHPIVTEIVQRIVHT